jgi:hypothetical protein
MFWGQDFFSWGIEGVPDQDGAGTFDQMYRWDE